MGKLEDKLAKLEEQRARINAEIQRVRAREQQQERRDDTRRKIIVGAMLTGMIEAGKLGQFNEVWLRAELDKQLDRDAAILRACQEFGYTQTQIAAATGLHNSTVSKIHEVL